MRINHYYNRSAILIFWMLFVFLKMFGQENLNIDEAKQYLLRQSGVVNYTTKGAGLILTDSYSSKNGKIKHLYFIQAFHGIEIIGTNSSVHLNTTNEIFHSTNALLDLNTVKPSSNSPGIIISDLLEVIARYYQIGGDLRTEIIKEDKSKNFNTVLTCPQLSKANIPIKLIYISEMGNKLRLCWELRIEEMNSHKVMNFRIDAQAGSILEMRNLTIECKPIPSKLRIGEEQSSSKRLNTNTHINSMVTGEASYEVFAIPLENPDDGARSVENSPWMNAINASPYGWHDIDGDDDPDFTTTQGNNVHAYEDKDGSSSTAGDVANGTSSLNFLFPLNLNDLPEDYQDASLTNLFYMNNIMHDVWYEYGFNEVSGNFQQNNYGNGGIGNDYVRAEGLDGGGENNANFFTPPDGSLPRMQMYQWLVTSKQLNVNSPASISGSYTISGASFGPQTADLTGTLVYSMPDSACTEITNPQQINGNIALIDRGDCKFVEKVQHAENAGAIAVLICNGVSGGTFEMGGIDPGLTIPSVMMSLENCNTIKAALPNVNVSLVLGPKPNRDGDLDNGIIAHEYGHGISIRLTGGPSQSICLTNQEQMGEGWSDYFARVLAIKETDYGADPKGMGSYVLGQQPGETGIRSFPYTTDIAINPHTYNDIKTLSRPHGLGSVWAMMLWEMTWALINEHGFDPDFYHGTGGNNIAMQLVIDGLKLQPCNPGFVDGRNAILKADSINNGAANVHLIWSAFAKRGLGWSANQGDADDQYDGIEAFDVPVFGCTISGANNYNPLATTDDGSCGFCIDGVMNGLESGIDCGGTCGNLCECTETNLSFVETIIPDATVKRALEWISTSGTVTLDHPANVFFAAGEYVLFSPGFEVPQGSSLTVISEACIDNASLDESLRHKKFKN